MRDNLVVVWFLAQTFTDPHVTDRPVGLDDHDPAVGHGVPVDGEVLEGHAVIADHRAVHVREEGELKPVFFGKGTVGKGRVDRDAKHRGTCIVEGRHGVTEAAHFCRADSGEGGGVEREHHPLTPVVGQGDLALVGRGEGEIRCSVANGDHGFGEAAIPINLPRNQMRHCVRGILAY